MKTTQLLPCVTILAMLLTGCNTMSRTQCAQGTRAFLLSNLLLTGPVEVRWQGGSQTLDRNESFEIVQFSDTNRLVQTIDIDVNWRYGKKRFSYPPEKLDPFFFGPRHHLDLFETPDLKDIVITPY